MLARIDVRKLPRLRAMAGLALALLLILGSAVPVAAGENSKHARGIPTLFATGQAGAVLLAIDVRERTTAVRGPAHPPGSLALAITPDGTAAYTIANFKGPNARLAKIVLATGVQEIVGSSPLDSLQIMGMTFAPDGVLYAAGDFNTSSSTFNSLYTIDLNSGLATRVGSLRAGPLKSISDFIMSFAWDSHGNLYGASMMSLYRIHLPRTTDARGGAAQSQEAGQGNEALATKVVDFVDPAVRPSAVMGIAIGGDGSFYAADFLCRPNFPPILSTIYAVNIETGFLKPLYVPSIPCVHNIAFSPER